MTSSKHLYHWFLTKNYLAWKNRSSFQLFQYVVGILGDIFILAKKKTSAVVTEGRAESTHSTLKHQGAT